PVRHRSAAAVLHGAGLVDVPAGALVFSPCSHGAVDLSREWTPNTANARNKHWRSQLHHLLLKTSHADAYKPLSIDVCKPDSPGKPCIGVVLSDEHCLLTPYLVGHGPTKYALIKYNEIAW
ncbi:MAG: hypothetical protein JAY74_05540, partial [Candidatus Thiodiazotropha taylori]|nr:hypothetical protein [Candidatus Thiodiazotropha taylori]